MAVQKSLKAIILLSIITVVYPSGCDNYVSTRDTLCYELFMHLQEQITGNEANLYSLRKVFYPTSQAEPTLVNVSYDLHVSFLENISCPGDPESEENPRYDHLSDELLPIMTVHAWSSKFFYTLFHPATISRLQPQYLQFILGVLDNIFTLISATVPTTTTWNTTGPILTLELYMDLKLPCLPTFHTLQRSLYDLTSFLKVYANTQKNLTSLDSQEKGYSLFGNVFIEQWWLSIDKTYPSSTNVPIFNAILSVFLTFAICFGVHHVLWNKAPSNSRQSNFRFSHSVTWCAITLLIQLNIAFMTSEAVNIWRWCDYQMSCQEPAAISKIVLLVWIAICVTIALFASFICCLRGKNQHNELLKPEWRAFIVSNPSLSLLALILTCQWRLLFRHLLRIKKLRKYLIRHSAFSGNLCPGVVQAQIETVIRFVSVYVLHMTVFVSASIFSFSLLPILLQAILYPFHIVAGYSFFFSALAIHTLATFIATFTWKERPPTTKKLLLCLSATVITSLLIIFVSVPFVSLYILLVTGLLSDNPLILLAFSLLSSLPLSSPLLLLLKVKFIQRFMEFDDSEGGSDPEKLQKVNFKTAINQEDEDDLMKSHPSVSESEIMEYHF